MFEINFFSRKQEFYRFSTDDFALLEIGIGNYTISSLENFFNKPNPDILEFFSGNTSTVLDNLTCKNSASNLEILAYDDSDYKYKHRRGLDKIKEINSSKYKPSKYSQIQESTLEGFLKKWTDIQLGIETTPNIVNSYKLIANRIQNSASGCITFNTNLNILGNNRSSLIKLFILNSKDNDSSRTIAFNGSPFISAIPQTAEGMRYGYSNTLNAGVGNYVGISRDENNPSDKVAGQLRTVWDPATKSWESGTQQILARLMDNIDATNVPEITGDRLASLTQSDVYDVKPEDNPIMGKPEKGRAVVISSENGNPNQFGPNFRGGCGNNSKKSIIKVVNRSQKSYKEGTLVVCSLINGEWIIISGEGKLEEARKISFGRFEFQQNIVPVNYYFTSPGDCEKLLPDVITTRARNKYYERVSRNDPSRPGVDDNALNLIASTIPEDSEDIIKYLTDTYLNTTLRNTIVQNAVSNTTVDGQLDIISYLDQRSMPEIIGWKAYSDFFQYGVPKNILARSNRTLNLNMPLVDKQIEGEGSNIANVEVDCMEVPLFWGTLFPDGYKSSGYNKFKDKVKGIITLENDPNLKELPSFAIDSSPDYGSEQANLRMLSDLKFGDNNLNPLNYIRKTGGINKLSRYVMNDVELMHRRDIADTFKQRVGGASFSTSGIYGLEPLNPKKIQFSPMSIQAMYLGSTLNYNAGSYTSDFQTLKNDVENLRSLELPAGLMPEGKKTLGDYYNALYSGYTNKSIIADRYFIGNTYDLNVLSFSRVFRFGDQNTTNSQLLTRHLAPLAVMNGHTIIPPFPVGGYGRRSPAIPTIAVKSVIKTNANGLTFTVPQYFGNPLKQTVVGGQVGSPVIIPPFLAWNTPSNPIAVNSTVQWGDPNRTDNIDSMGTTALHVKIFEHWPEDRTFFIGPYYTVLHYNPGLDIEDGRIRSYNEESGEITSEPKPTDEPGVFVEPRSSVDFKVPTRKNGTIIDVGYTAYKTEDNNNDNEMDLAPFSDWEYDTIRRNKLLSGGGFAYFKQVLILDPMLGDPIKNGGSGYEEDDEFILPQGSTFTVAVDEGKIVRIKSFTSNSEGYIVKDPSKFQEITSLDIQPEYLGTSGQGAIFSFRATVGYLIQHDSAPKEVVKQTRLTSSSAEGAEGPVYKTNSVSVDISNSDKNEFDMFYFFHNDPTTYGSLSFDLVFNNTNAHYVISEVNPI